MMKTVKIDEAPHMGFAEIWGLGRGPNPELMKRFFRWLVDDPMRFNSAADSMQWLPVGFNTFPVALRRNNSGRVVESLQMNLYHPDFPGNDGAHGHSKDAVTTWYAPKGSRQIITRERPLPIDAPKLEGVRVVERLVVANAVVDLDNGGRPDYHPYTLGRTLVLPQSETRVAPLGCQSFVSTEVHSVAHQGEGVAISVHWKGAVEPDSLNGVEGLVHYKGLPRDGAEEISELRRSMVGDLPEGAYMGPVTMLYPGLDFRPEDMSTTAEPTSRTTAEMLIMSGLRTVEQLAA